ncbi:hypothetical protein ILUMI_08690 [Ignelater luminosus]|uniref:Uncharacterized protein n=1 Tax=Ignelater luminosus TaxID=2038154 RepID=A0A8K0D591_IGNLU|nr:hypothetical protein ILUMI_08690 [Ignelater luminosus]
MIWREILKIILDAILFCAKNNECIDRTNKALQQKDLLIDCGTKLIAVLRSTLQGLRDTGFEQTLQEVQNLAEEMDIDRGFLNKRKRRGKKLEIDATPDEGSNLIPEELFKIQIYCVLDTLLSQIDWRYQKMKTSCDDFCFLYGSSLQLLLI